MARWSLLPDWVMQTPLLLLPTHLVSRSLDDAKAKLGLYVVSGLETSAYEGLSHAGFPV